MRDASRSTDTNNNRIGVLDGWRAIAAGMVIVSHVFELWTLGWLGVEFFFAISGYVICRGFIVEHSKYGRVSLPAFYIRRALRIIPPLILYVGVIYLLAAAGYIEPSAKQTIRALTFTCNLGHCGGWIGDHTWSLSVEEQFYLVIPALFVIGAAHFRRSVSAAVMCVPVAVIVLYLCRLPDAAQVAAMFLTIAFAVAYALYEERLRPAIAAMPAITWLAAVGGIFILHGWSGSRPATMAQVFLLPMVIVFVPLWTTAHVGFVSKIIGSRPLQAAGLISYSLYLWQEPLTVPGTPMPLKLLGVAGALGVAYVSYWIVEVRLISLGRRASDRLRGQDVPLREAACAAVAATDHKPNLV